MMATSTAIPTLTIAILTKQWPVWFGLQQIFESSPIAPMVLLTHQLGRPDMLPPGAPADVFILDLETERDAIHTIEHIRQSHPTGKIVLLSGFEDKTAHAKPLTVASTVSFSRFNRPQSSLR